MSQLKQYQERFDHVTGTRDEQAMAMLPAVREAFSAHKRQLDTTLTVIDGESRRS
jgi:methyl-accepting chemotaxis protein